MAGSEISRLEGELEEALRREEFSRQAMERCQEEARAAQSKLEAELQASGVELAKNSSAMEILQDEAERLRAENLKDRKELTHWVERATRAEATLDQAEQKKPRKLATPPPDFVLACVKATIPGGLGCVG